jgi:hypothetical protein
MKTGIQLITEERIEQTDKHDHTVKGDIEGNSSGQLRKAAIFCLTLNPGDAPSTWDDDFEIRMEQDRKSDEGYIHRLKVAGALIAAEIDRVLNK